MKEQRNHLKFNYNRNISIGIFILLFLFSIQALQAQVLKGVITGEKKEPLSYASIYVAEAQTGAMSNEKGEYALLLSDGEYTVRFQYMGYQTLTKKIRVSGVTTANIRLEVNSITLKPLVFKVKNEDPAYRIIRKAVAKAPYYYSQLSYCNINAYLKGVWETKKIPEWMKLLSKNADESEDEDEVSLVLKEGTAYVKESIIEKIDSIGKKTEQKVLSENSSLPKFLDSSSYSVFDLILGYDIYAPSSPNSYISPISSQALSYYKYELLNTNEQEGQKIYHIKVIPKTGNPHLFSGTIDIIDSLWAIYHLDLSGQMNTGIMNAKFKFQNSYSEVEANHWLITSILSHFDIKIMGVETSTINTSSLKYVDYLFNNSQRKSNLSDTVSFDTTSVVISKKSEKLQQEIDKLLEKEVLSNRDAKKLAELAIKKEKEDKKNNPLPSSKSKGDELEAKGMEEYISITKDSTYRSKDSSYWEEHRLIPLAEDEKKGFEEKAISLKKQLDKQNDSTKSDSLAKEKMVQFLFSSLQISISDSTKFKLNFLNLDFNLVDGWSYGWNASLSKKLGNDKFWEGNLSASYAFSNKHFPVTFKWKYNYLPQKFGSVGVFAGRRSLDFNAETGMERGLNALSSLFFRNNYITFYDGTYLGATHEIEAFNGFKVNAAFYYNKQNQLHNETDYSFFFRHSHDYRTNEPDNTYILSNSHYLNDASSSILAVAIQYTPRMHYQYQGKTKRNLSSKYPTFSFLWKKGIGGLFNTTANYDRLEAGIKQELTVGLFDNFSYNVTGGWFPNNKEMHFSNFKHFAIYEFPFSTRPLSPAFHTMKTYSASTNEWYLSASAYYSTPYLLLKYIPIFDKTLMNENLYASYLKTPITNNYIEVGYALSNIYMLGNVGVFVGFENFNYSNWGIKISIPLIGEFFK